MGVEWSGLFCPAIRRGCCPADMAPGTLPHLLHGPRPLPLLPNDLLPAPPRRFPPRDGPSPVIPTGCSLLSHVAAVPLGFSGAVQAAAPKRCAPHIPGVWPRDCWPRTGYILHPGHALPLPTRRAQRSGGGTASAASLTAGRGTEAGTSSPGSRHAQVPTALQLLLAVPVRQQPVVTDAHKPRRHHMLPEPPDELERLGSAHRLFLAWPSA